MHKNTLSHLIGNLAYLGVIIFGLPAAPTLMLGITYKTINHQTLSVSIIVITYVVTVVCFVGLLALLISSDGAKSADDSKQNH